MKKRLIIIITLILFLLLSSCKNDDRNSQLIDLSMTKTPIKTIYYEDEDFDETGAIFTATYSDNSTKDVTNQIIYKNTNLILEQTHVIATYKENGKELSVNIEII